VELYLLSPTQLKVFFKMCIILSGNYLF
jgi:hypothetical protein